MTAKELKTGMIFKDTQTGEIFRCTNNDGFILEAENMDSNSLMKEMMLVGGLSNKEVEVIK